MKKILIIDDDSVACVQAQHALESEYEITITSSAKKAPEMMNTVSFDLILLDVYMPGINGIDFLKELEKNEAHPPVILISADPEPDTEAHGLECGAADFVHKPYCPSVLKARVDRVIAESELKKELFWRYNDH